MMLKRETSNSIQYVYQPFNFLPYLSFPQQFHILGVSTNREGAYKLVTPSDPTSLEQTCCASLSLVLRASNIVLTADWS